VLMPHRVFERHSHVLDPHGSNNPEWIVGERLYARIVGLKPTGMLRSQYCSGSSDMPPARWITGVSRRPEEDKGSMESLYASRKGSKQNYTFDFLSFHSLIKQASSMGG
jgi:hypothetical protein